MGDSTLALDEEMLQVMDAVDLSKSEVKRDVKEKHISDPFPPPRPTTPNALSRMERNSGMMKDRETIPCTNGGVDPLQRGCRSRGDSNKPGWSADCKDLAQKLLFSEDSGEVDHPQRDQQNNHSNHLSASVCTLPCIETSNSRKADGSSK